MIPSITATFARGLSRPFHQLVAPNEFAARSRSPEHHHGVHIAKFEAANRIHRAYTAHFRGND
jgi:hypothetical protein